MLWYQSFLLPAVAVQLCAAGCIPVLPMWAIISADERQLKNFYFDGSTNIIQENDNFVNALNQSTAFKILVLERIISHAASYSACRDIENGEVFFQLGSKNAAQELILSTSAAVEMLPDSLFPVRVWSTTSYPPFRIVLDGANEVMSDEVMKPDVKWIYNQVKMIVTAISETKNRSGVIIDVGANLGIVALYCAALGEDIIAFEATTKNALSLKASCVLNGWCPSGSGSSRKNVFSNNSRFAIFENAVSDIDGADVRMRVDWYVADNVTNGGANSMFAVENESDMRNIFETATSITLDTALSSLSLLPDIGASPADFKPRNHISMLKMDCEGCEPLALLGAPRLFQYNAPLSMMVEINPERLRAAGVNVFDFLVKLENFGYDIIHVADNEHLSPISPGKIDQILLIEEIFDVLAFIRSVPWKFKK